MGTLFTAQLVRGWCQMLTTVDIHREDAQRDIEIKLRARPAGHQDVVARQQQQVERCVQKSEQISNQISRVWLVFVVQGWCVVCMLLYVMRGARL